MIVKTNSSKIDKLMAQLKDFGLNPQDWKARSSSVHKVQLVHKQDHDFRLIGLIDPRKNSWQNLLLENI